LAAQRAQDWIDAEYCINLDGGEFEKVKGKRLLAGLQAAKRSTLIFNLKRTIPAATARFPGRKTPSMN